jgi:hypothetical protein
MTSVEYNPSNILHSSVVLNILSTDAIVNGRIDNQFTKLLRQINSMAIVKIYETFFLFKETIVEMGAEGSSGDRFSLH